MRQAMEYSAFRSFGRAATEVKRFGAGRLASELAHRCERATCCPRHDHMRERRV